MGRRMRQAITTESSEAAQYSSGRTRDEHDLLGDKEVPHDAYYGIQTLRGMENFHITGVPISHYPNLINALAYVKMAAAKANGELGLMPKELAEAIVQAGNDVVQGKLHNHFVLDMIQGGAGTSTNMNVNEVLANRANEILGYKRGDYDPVHPNNHVNLGQSTNDAYPSSLKIAMALSNITLVLELEELVESFMDKAKEFAKVLKMGRTQLQDAVPMTLGQEFEAYGVALADEIRNLNDNARLLLKLNMGGTAIGTGLNAAPEFGPLTIKHLNQMTGLNVSLAQNLIESTQSTSAFVMYSAALKQLAIKLSKIANDLRLLSSGPRAGLNEINLPKMQPGSSIMPGKVNPVIPEVVNQVAFKVIGDDLTVTLAAEGGQLELNVMEPVIADCIFESIEMLKNGIATFKYRCVDGITANMDVCQKYVETSIGLVTALNPVLGYEVSTKLAKEALETNKGIYELVLEKNLMSKEELDEALDPENMLKPQLQAKKK
jgi:aspartate ammonia-lyase